MCFASRQPLLYIKYLNIYDGKSLFYDKRLPFLPLERLKINIMTKQKSGCLTEWWTAAFISIIIFENTNGTKDGTTLNQRIFKDFYFLFAPRS